MSFWFGLALAVLRLFVALDSLLGHLDETILGFALGEVRNGGNGLFGVVVGKGAGLLNAVALEDKVAGLQYELTNLCHEVDGVLLTR